jgi:hypothetical protein
VSARMIKRSTETAARPAIIRFALRRVVHGVFALSRTHATPRRTGREGVASFPRPACERQRIGMSSLHARAALNKWNCSQLYAVGSDAAAKHNEMRPQA